MKPPTTEEFEQMRADFRNGNLDSITERLMAAARRRASERAARVQAMRRP